MRVKGLDLQRDKAKRESILEASSAKRERILTPYTLPKHHLQREKAFLKHLDRHLLFTVGERSKCLP